MDTITTSPQEPPSKKRKTKNSDEVETIIVRTLKRIEERRAERQVEDEEELFGRQIAATLRRLNCRQKAMVKLIFQQVLMDIEFPKDTVNNQLNYTFQ